GPSRPQRRIVPEDRRLDLAQLWPRLETELVRDPLPEVPERFERLRLASRCIERAHQLRVQALAVWVHRRELLDLRHESRAGAGVEIVVDPLLERREAQLLEPAGGEVREPAALQVDE